MRTLVATFLLIVAFPAAAQTSPSFKLEEQTQNAGGRPEQGTSAISSSFKITLDAIGDTVVASGPASPSFKLGSGFVVGHTPPGEVTGLMFDDGQSLSWDPAPSAGLYNLYRGLVSGVGSYGACTQQDLAQPGAVDNDAVPNPGGFFYLATVKNSLDEEGTRGFNSGGTERTGTVCP